MSSVTLFPQPPPTFNNLEPLQRTRLLRSTRKLESLLGTTPYVLEQADTVVPTSTSKARRREVQIFGNYPLPSPIIFATPHSADGKTSPVSDGSFVLISPASSLETPLPPVELTLNTDSDAEIFRFSEKYKPATRVKPSKNKEMLPEEHPRPIKRSRSKSTHKKSASANAQKASVPTPLPHTLVLCQRSDPVSKADARIARGNDHSYLSSMQTQTQVHTLQILNVPTSPASPTTPSPLSPVSPTFYSSNHSESDRERVDERQKSKERDQRRKNMAKLARTLGENVPPELVFPGPIPTSVDLDTHKPPSRSRSVTMHKFATSQIASSVDSPPAPTASTVERHPSRHRYEKKLDTTHKHLAKSSSDALQADGGRTGNHGGHSEGHWPPSLAMLFHPHPHPHLTSERPQHHKKHPSPPPSPADLDVFVKHEVFSDSHPPSTSTSASASTSPSAPPTLKPRRPSLSIPKPSQMVAGGGSKVSRSHSLKTQTHTQSRNRSKSESMDVVNEVFGFRTRACAVTGENCHPSDTLQHQECGRRKGLGWSGEWNRGDMDEVVKALRGLKAR